MKNNKSSLQDLPSEFLIKLSGLLGSDFDSFITSQSQPPGIGLRVNTLKLSPDEFNQHSPFKLTEIPWCVSGFMVEKPDLENTQPGKHPYHFAGLYYLQEPSSMAVSEALLPQPGEKVLDLAAAPGGKSTHLAALMKNTGLLVANEIHPKRVWDLSENLERCGVKNAVVTNEDPQKLADYFLEYFDRVLLDAPCSGEGMFRKNVNARKEWKPDSPLSCSVRQSTIMEQAARMVKPGGMLAYSTCTFSPEENEAVLAGFLDKHPEFDLATIENRPGLSPARPEWIGLPMDHEIKKAIRIWPHNSVGEGHFIALLIKSSSTLNTQMKISTRRNGQFQRNLERKGEISVSMSIFDDFTRVNLNLSLDRNRVKLHGPYVYSIPDELPDITGLRVIRPGWWLGTIQKNRFTPSHGLAMGIQATESKRVIAFQPGAGEVSRYLSGESFVDPGESGWVLVTVDGYPMGWGKRVQNIVKNFYPHRLRRK